MICQTIGPTVLPTTLTRLSRRPVSPHINIPWLLEVTLSFMEEIKLMMLDFYFLHLNSPYESPLDVHWTEKQKLRKVNLHESKSIRNMKEIFINGIPDLNDSDKANNYQHDCNEYSYIRVRLQLQSISTTKVKRLTASIKYKGSGPHTLSHSVVSWHGHQNTWSLVHPQATRFGWSPIATRSRWYNALFQDDLLLEDDWSYRGYDCIHLLWCHFWTATNHVLYISGPPVTIRIPCISVS